MQEENYYSELSGLEDLARTLIFVFEYYLTSMDIQTADESGEIRESSVLSAVSKIDALSKACSKAASSVETAFKKIGKSVKWLKKRTGVFPSSKSGKAGQDKTRSSQSGGCGSCRFACKAW